MGLALKGKNLLLKEQILSLRADPILEGLRRPGKQTEGYKSYLPLKTPRKHGGVRTYLSTHIPKLEISLFA